MNTSMKKRFALITLSLALTCSLFGSSASYAPKSAVSGAYIDVTAETAAPATGNFYLIGAPHVEDAQTYLYLLRCDSSSPTPDFVKVPCLPSDDPSHPYGVSESDFVDYCLPSLFRWSIVAGNIGYLAFPQKFFCLLADSTSGRVGGTDTSSASFRINPTYNSTTGKISSVVLSGFNVDFTQSVYAYTHTPSVDTGTDLQLLAPSSDLLARTTAVGFGMACSAGTYTTSAAAHAVFEKLPYEERETFLARRGSPLTSGAPTQALESLISNGDSAYEKLYTSAGEGVTYAPSAPTGLGLDYALDRLTGLNNDNKYKISYTPAGSSAVAVGNIIPSEGACPLYGNCDNVEYDCAGQSIEVSIYSSNTLLCSEGTAVSVLDHGTAPSVAPSPLSLAISSSESVPGVYSDHISVPTIDNARYYLAESSASSPEFNYSGAQWFSGGDIAKTSGLGDALSPETSYRLYWRTHYEETCDSTVPKDSQQAYLYYEFTTLSALESAKRVALIQSYRDYGTSLAGLSSGATSDNLARMLVSLRSKIEAADTSGIATYSSDYLNKAYAFALAQDAAVASLRSGANLLVSDSDRSTLAFTEAVNAIASLDYFAGADISLASSLVDAALIQISGYRYSEALAQQLVAYFNDAILAKATGFNASDRAALWTLFDRGFKSVLNASGSDLATLKAQADAAFSQAKSDLAILLAQEKSAYVS